MTENISVLGDLMGRWQWRGSCALLIFLSKIYKERDKIHVETGK